MTNFVMKYFVMEKLCTYLKKRRSELGLKVKDIVMLTGIDQSIISKIESGARIPTVEQVDLVTMAYQIDSKVFRKYWLAEKIVNLVAYDTDVAVEAMNVVEDRIEYLRNQHKVFQSAPLNDALQKKLDQIEELHNLWSSHKPLQGTQLVKMREYFKIQYTYQSNKIEGNTLSLQETELVVHQGITISGKSMQEHLEAINHAEAASYLIDIVKDHTPFTFRILRELHGLILRGIDKENAGVYRKVPVRISGSQHIPPQPYLLDKLMEDYFKYYSSQYRKLHPVILAAEMHERLVSIHPFIDGNGRTSRLVMNLILLQNGYPIAILKGDNHKRLEYYKALEAVQVDSDPLHFYKLVFDEVAESLQEHLELVGVSVN